MSSTEDQSLGKKNVKELLNGYKLSVPGYQRIYAWGEAQYEQFWEDIEDYLKFQAQNPSLKYFIGHILLEKEKETYGIVDGQQRITTMVIVLNILQKLLNRNDMNLKNFSTGKEEKICFNDYIIDAQLPPKEISPKTASMRHCLDAHKHFYKKISKKNETERETIYNLLLETECTMQIMENKIDTVRRFIFENGRGKPVNNFEKFKALCMYELYVQGREGQINDLEERITAIYQHLEAIHSSHYDEDMLLRDAARIYFNDLVYSKLSPEEIIESLKKEKIVENIESFSQLLLKSATAYEQFINDGKNSDNKELAHTIRALCYLGITKLRPFIIKAYLEEESKENKVKLFQHLEHLLFRHKLIGTRAELKDRLKWYIFGENHWNVDNIVGGINHLFMNNDRWWGHWNNEKYKAAVREEFIKDAYNSKGNVAQYVLYKYEHHLWEAEKRQTLPEISFNDMKRESLEHIAPRTPSEGKEKYDDDFKRDCLDALGNLILIPLSNNIGASNDDRKKYEEYEKLSSLLHVREIKDKVKQGAWDENAINERTQKLEKFMIETLASDFR